jgi:hypothetical protein
MTTMSKDRIAAIAVLGLRVAYGAGLIVAPARLSRSWLGPAGQTPPVQVPLRGMGAREIAVHGAGLIAVLRGAPLRPWLAASIAGDIADTAATAAGRSGLPAGAAPKTAAVAGGSALLTAAVAAAVER